MENTDALTNATTTGGPRYRILSLDGGGIRGIVTLEILAALEQRLGVDFTKQFDLIAGTSTGGMIALGLAAGVSVSELRRLYIEHGTKIFPARNRRGLAFVLNLIRPRYDSRILERQIVDQLKPDTTLGDLTQKVLITTFDATGRRKGAASVNSAKAVRWSAKFFHNFEGHDNGPHADKDCDWNQPAWKIALYTAAAPVFLPIQDGFIDGGVVAVNPSVAAIAQTQDPRYFQPQRTQEPPSTARQSGSTFVPKLVVPNLHDISVLSIGTGQSITALQASALDEGHRWGFWKWLSPLGKPLTPLISLMTDGDSNVADFVAKQLLNERYRRIQVMFEPGIDFDMDVADKIGEMQHATRDAAVVASIDEVANWFKAGAGVWADATTKST
jgi:hypothetical protein